MKSRSFYKLFETILLILFGVLMYVSQVLMAALPNIEIVTLLIIVVVHKFGYKALISIYVFVGCEILTYGIHIWVINYLYVWAILCLIICVLRKVDNAVIYSIIAAVFGLLFGTLCSIPYFIIGGISGGIANIISGLTYDLLHCGGNLISTLILYRPLAKCLDRAVKTA